MAMEAVKNVIKVQRIEVEGDGAQEGRRHVLAGGCTWDFWGGGGWWGG